MGAHKHEYVGEAVDAIRARGRSRSSSTRPFFYAAVDADDRNNARAATVLSDAERLVTSDHVLVETWLLLARRLGYHVAEQFWETLRGGAAHVEPVTAGDREVAYAIGESFPDHEFPIIDRTSFAVMQRLGVFRVASLDQHFAVFRFGRDRRRAFEIVG